MKKIPTVASDAYPYTNNATEAFLCSDLGDWEHTLDMLIKSPEKRLQHGLKAYESVTQTQQYKDSGNLWVEAANTVIKNHQK